MLDNSQTKTSRAQIDSVQRYKKKFDLVQVMVSRGKKETWRKAADTQGQSLTKFVTDAVDDRCRQIQNEVDNGEQV